MSKSSITVRLCIAIVVLVIAFGFSAIPTTSVVPKQLQPPSRLKWQVRPSSDWIYDICSINDVNGDGIRDIVAGSLDGYVYCLSGADGSTLWSANLAGGVRFVSEIDDWNGDGVNDIVATSYDACCVHIINAKSGVTLKSWSAPNTNHKIFTAAILPDVTNDGYPEIVVGCWDEGATYYGHTYCIKGKELTTHWVHSHGVTGLEVRAVTALCVIPDVNGDGFWDVVAGHETVCAYYNRLVCISGANGEAIWGGLAATSSNPERINWVIAVPDVNGDGFWDVFATGWSLYNGYEIWMIEGDQCNEIWHEYHLEFRARCAVRVPDIDGDGKPEVVVGMDDVVCYSGASGNQLWTLSVTGGPWSIGWNGDANSDGIEDLIVGCSEVDGGVSYGEVDVFSYENGDLLWKYQMGSMNITAVCSVGDIDGDGISDVVGGTDIGMVFCLSADAVQPLGQIITPSDGDYVPQQITFEVQASDNGRVDSVALYIDDAFVSWMDYQDNLWVYTHTFSLTEEGAHTAYVEIYDAAGNVYRTVPISFTVDLTEPSLTVTGPPDGSYLSQQDVTIEWTSSDNYGVTEHEVWVDGSLHADNLPGTQTSYTVTGLGESSYTIEVKAYDAAGNVDSDSITITIDLTAPEINILIPEEGGEYAPGDVTVMWEGSDNYGIDYYEVRIDGGAWVNVGTETSYTFHDVGEGSHTVEVKAIDFAGNEAVASVEFTLKAGAPPAPEQPPGVGGPSAPTAPGPEEAVRGAAPTMLYVGIAVAVVAGVAVAAVLLLRRRRVAGSESA